MLDFSSKGLLDGLKRVGSVAIYIIVSMAVIGLSLYVSNQSISWNEVKGAVLVGGANLVLVFLQTWLSSKK